MEHTVHYYIGGLGREQLDNNTWCLSYIMDNPPDRANVLEYWWTTNIYEAKKFNSKEEVFKYLLNNPQQYDGAMLLEYSDKYLESIKDNKKALWYISHPITREYVKCPYEEE